MSGRTHIPGDVFISLRNGDEVSLQSVRWISGRTENKAADKDERGSGTEKQREDMKRHEKCRASLCTHQNIRFCIFHCGGRRVGNAETTIAELLRL